MSDRLPVELHFNKGMAIGMLVCSAIILLSALLTGRLFPQALTGGILLLGSYGYLTQVAMVVAENEVQLRNLLGMTVKRVPFDSARDLELRDGRLLVKRQKVGAGRWTVNGADWERLDRAITASRQA